MICSAPAAAPHGFRSRWRMVGRLRLHVLESAGGHDPAVVLLPGLMTASRSMVPLAHALVSRSARVRILNPPGFGYSDKPPRALSVHEQGTLVGEWLAADGCRRARYSATPSALRSQPRWDFARSYLATQAAAHNVTFDENRVADMDRGTIVLPLRLLSQP